MKKFEVNKSYVFGFIGDSDLKVTIKVVKRTAKFLTFEESNGEQAKRKIQVSDEGEYINPYGVYSMSPTCRAKNEVKEEDAQEEQEVEDEGMVDFYKQTAINYGVDYEEVLEIVESGKPLYEELDFLVRKGKFKGTKGNWEIEGDLDDLRVEVKDEESPNYFIPKNIAYVVQGGDEIPRYEEAEANARLIKNSPKLLDLVIRLSFSKKEIDLRNQAKDLLKDILGG